MSAYALALLGALCLPSAADAQRYEPPKYDPKSCKVDTEGRIFVALRNQFMAIPVNQFGFAEPHYPDSPRKPTLAADLSEPLGCPGNPIQTTRYVPRLRLALPPLASGAPDPGWAVDRLELIYTDPEPVKGRAGVVWGGEEINLGNLDRVCARGHPGKPAQRVAGVPGQTINSK